MSEIELKPCPFWRDGFLCADFDGRCIEEHCKVLPELRKRDARIAELESQVDDLQGELAQSAAVSRIVELEAERDRLREAMKRIANQPDCYTSIRDLMDKKNPGNADEKRIAQEALKGDSK